MKGVVCLVVALVISMAWSQEEAKDKETGERPSVYQRLIPADVLRDFPGTCFASTRCATFEPGATWELKPFCGKSTCIAQQGRLWELVEDCGPLPKPNPKCKLSDKTNKTADFPMCCPVFECEPGVTLEYPDIRGPEQGGPGGAPGGPGLSGNGAVAPAPKPQ